MATERILIAALFCQLHVLLVISLYATDPNTDVTFLAHHANVSFTALAKLPSNISVEAFSNIRQLSRNW